MSEPKEGSVVVLLDLFFCSLRRPPYGFLCKVLEVFGLQLHHLTCNGILTLTKFCWFYESYRAIPNNDTFCIYFELQKQSKNIKMDQGELIA